MQICGMSCPECKKATLKRTRFGLACPACQYVVVCTNGHEYDQTRKHLHGIACTRCGFEIDLEHPVGVDVSKSDTAVNVETAAILDTLRNKNSA